MTPQERCEAAENSINAARKLLLSPSPAALEECLQILSQVIETLETLVAGSSRDWDPLVHAAIRRIRFGVSGLRVQIGHGANLISGWMQLRMGEGYTRAGSPELTDQGSNRLLEA